MAPALDRDGGLFVGVCKPVDFINHGLQLVSQLVNARLRIFIKQFAIAINRVAIHQVVKERIRLEVHLQNLFILTVQSIICAQAIKAF